MKRVFLWIVVVLFAGSAYAQQTQPTQPTATETLDVAPPAHPATEDQIREYLSLTQVEKTSHNLIIANVNAMQLTSVPYFPASFWTDMKSEFLKLDITALYVPIFQRYLSEEDMNGILAFYRSPAGHKLLETQPMLTRDAQVALKAKGRELGEAIYAKHKDEIDAAKKKYDAEHGTGK